MRFKLVIIFLLPLFVFAQTDTAGNLDIVWGGSEDTRMSGDSLISVRWGGETLDAEITLSEDAKAFIYAAQNIPPGTPEGWVKLSFAVDDFGNTYDHQVMQSLTFAADREAIRVARFIKFDQQVIAQNPIKRRLTVKIGFGVQ